MPQEKFPAMLWRRTRDLVEKFYGVKNVFTVLVTITFFKGLVPVWMFTVAWVLFIGGRYVPETLVYALDQLEAEGVRVIRVPRSAPTGCAAS